MEEFSQVGDRVFMGPRMFELRERQRVVASYPTRVGGRDIARRAIRLWRAMLSEAVLLLVKLLCMQKSISACEFAAPNGFAAFAKTKAEKNFYLITEKARRNIPAGFFLTGTGQILIRRTMGKIFDILFSTIIMMTDVLSNMVTNR